MWTFRIYNVVNGDAGDNVLRGGPGIDILYGYEGNDELYGGGDADRLYGHEGADRLYGGDGEDVFTFGSGHGNDTIGDFTVGEDLIDLYPLRLSGFDALALSSASGGVMIDLSGHGGGTILLEGVQVTDLSAADFLFA